MARIRPFVDAEKLFPHLAKGDYKGSTRSEQRKLIRYDERISAFTKYNPDHHIYRGRGANRKNAQLLAHPPELRRLDLKVTVIPLDPQTKGTKVVRTKVTKRSIEMEFKGPKGLHAVRTVHRINPQEFARDPHGVARRIAAQHGENSTVYMTVKTSKGSTAQAERSLSLDAFLGGGGWLNDQGERYSDEADFVEAFEVVELL